MRNSLWDDSSYYRPSYEPPPSHEWTDGEVERLRELWAEGLSAGQIAAKMGMSRNAILGKRFRLSLPKRADANVARMKREARERKDRERRDRRNKEMREKRAAAAAGRRKPNPEGLPYKADPRPLRVSAWVAIDNREPIPLLQLNDHTCKWPIDHEGRTLFCGAHSETGTPYCDHHRALARPKEMK